MSSLDWEWLKQSCMKWIKDKCNDVIAIDNLVKLKDEAETRGFTREQVSKEIHKCRKIINEDNASDKQPTMGAPKEKPPAAPKEEMQQLHDMQAQKDRGRPSASIRRDIQIGAEESRGGRPKRQSKLSIIDIAEGKQTL